MKNKIYIICVLAHLHIYTSAQNTGIGITTPAGKLHIKGSADISQLIIDANSTQSNLSPLVRLRNSSGSDLIHIHSDHNLNTFIGLNSGRVNLASGFNGIYNSFIGSGTGYSNTSGYANTATGSNALFYNTTGYGNTAIGGAALFLNDLGYLNTSIGPNSLYSNTGGYENIAIGARSLYSNTTGDQNTALGVNTLYYNVGRSGGTAIGYNAMYYANDEVSTNTNGNVAVGYESLMGSTTASANTGNWNSAVGYQTLRNNVSGTYNTAMGNSALLSNINGSSNVANGSSALRFNTTASQNIAIGGFALQNQSFSNGGIAWVSNNVAIGYEALYSNESTTTTEGIRNTAVGNYALHNNTIGYSNTAVGFEALRGSLTPSVNTGDYNTAIGYKSLLTNSSGNYNTALGDFSLQENQSGFYNTAIGDQALDQNVSGYYNTVIGAIAGNSGTSQSNNTIVGTNAYINNNASGSTAIGYGATTNTNNLVVLGFPPITATGGYTTWSNWSDGRFKKNITENVKGLDFIMRLRPVTYQMDVQGLYSFWETSPYGNNKMKTNEKSVAFINDAIQKKESVVATGFIAQEVEKAAAETGYNFSGVIKPAHDKDHYRIAYAEFVVPLVKAIQEQQKMISDLQNEIKELKKLVQK